MGPTWGPSGADRTQVGPMLAPWTLLSWMSCQNDNFKCIFMTKLNNFYTENVQFWLWSYWRWLKIDWCFGAFRQQVITSTSLANNDNAIYHHWMTIDQSWWSLFSIDPFEEIRTHLYEACLSSQVKHWNIFVLCISQTKHYEITS